MTMSVLTTGAFWAATAERAIRTAAQTGISVLTVDAATKVTGVADIDWSQTASIVGLATLLSVLFSVVGSNVGNAGPSFSKEVLTPPAPPIPADPANPA